MDEPFEGVDAVGARLMKDILLEQVRHGATVFLTSHVLEVVERLCDRVAIINRGKIVAEGTVAELRQQSAGGGNTLEDIFVNMVGAQRTRKSSIGCNDVATDSCHFRGRSPASPAIIFPVRARVHRSFGSPAAVVRHLYRVGNCGCRLRSKNAHFTTAELGSRWLTWCVPLLADFSAIYLQHRLVASLKRNLPYPVRDPALFGIEVLLRLTSAPEMFLVLGGAIIGLIRHPLIPLLAPFLLFLYVPFNLFFQLAVRDLVLYSFQRHSFRELFAAVVISLAILPQFLARTPLGHIFRPYFFAAARGRWPPGKLSAR